MARGPGVLSQSTGKYGMKFGLCQVFDWIFFGILGNVDVGEEWVGSPQAWACGLWEWSVEVEVRAPLLGAEEIWGAFRGCGCADPPPPATDFHRYAVRRREGRSVAGSGGEVGRGGGGAGRVRLLGALMGVVRLRASLGPRAG